MGSDVACLAATSLTARPPSKHASLLPPHPCLHLHATTNFQHHPALKSPQESSLLQRHYVIKASNLKATEKRVWSTGRNVTRHSSFRGEPRTSLHIYYALYLLEMRVSYWLSFSPSHFHSHLHLQANRMPRFALACCTRKFLEV